MRPTDLEPYRRRSERIVENENETPPAAPEKSEREKWDDQHQHMSAWAHKRESRYHDRLRQKHPWDSPEAKRHGDLASRHRYAAMRKEDAEKRKAKEHKKLHGADEASYKTGHHVMQDTSSRLSRESKHKYGTVSHHHADYFHVQWENGDKTKHSQKTGAEFGTVGHGRMGHFYAKTVSHVPDGMTPEQHRTKYATDTARRKAEQERKDSHMNRVSRVTTALSNIHHSKIQPHHLEALERLHHEIHKSQSED